MTNLSYDDLMGNARILKVIINFKARLRQELDKTGEHSNDMKYWIWKTLIMAEIAHRSVVLNASIEIFEKQYFDRYVAVARHFRDWNMDWVADNYFEMSNYVAKYFWPDTDKNGFENDFIPFKTFDI